MKNEGTLYVQKDNFIVFDSNGRLNKKELQLLIGRLGSEKFANCGEKTDLNSEGLIGDAGTVLKIIKPQRDHRTNLINHISYQSFDSTIFQIKKISDEAKYNFERIFDKKCLQTRCDPEREKKTFSLKKELDGKYMGSKVVFETIFQEKYQSVRIEKCCLFTGIFFSNNIIINIPYDQLCYPNYWLGYEEIVKVCYAYFNALDLNGIDNADQKTIVIAIREISRTKGKLTEIEQLKVIMKVEKIFTNVKDSMITALKKKYKITGKMYIEDVITCKVFFLPNARLYEEDYVTGIKKLTKDICMSRQITLFWEDNILYKPNEELISASGHVSYRKIEHILDSFELFEKHIVSFPNFYLAQIKPRFLISDLYCHNLFDLCLSSFRDICAKLFVRSKLQFTMGLGEEIDLMFEQIQAYYYTKGHFYQNTETFGRKLNLLRETYYLDMRCVWFRQIDFLSEYLKSTFKQHLLEISPDHRLEQTSNSIIQVMDNKFNSLIQTIIPSYNKGSWNCTYYRDVFRKSIRSLLETKIKNAYNKGWLSRRERKQPISVWFHALFPHPFGKDTNGHSFDQEDSFVFEEKKERIETKANLMRYIIQKPRVDLNNSRDKKIVNTMKNEDFIFKEKPKKAMQRSAAS